MMQQYQLAVKYIWLGSLILLCKESLVRNPSLIFNNIKLIYTVIEGMSESPAEEHHQPVDTEPGGG